MDERLLGDSLHDLRQRNLAAPDRVNAEPLIGPIIAAAGWLSNTTQQTVSPAKLLQASRLARAMLWSAQLDVHGAPSPMSYAVDVNSMQLVAVASGGAIYSFTLE